MEERSFLAGLELGKFIIQLADTRRRLDTVEKKVDEISGMMRRGAILATLWGIAIVANVYPDKAAEMVVEIARSAIRP